MNVNELTMAILDWESEAQESFTDYYMHDCINWYDWAKWLFNNGHSGRAIHIRYQIKIVKNTCIDQDLLFRVHGTKAQPREDYALEVVEWQDDDEKWSELYRKDVFLWAQYMCSNKETLWHIKEWLRTYPETWLAEDYDPSK